MRNHGINKRWFPCSFWGPTILYSRVRDKIPPWMKVKTARQKFLSERRRKLASQNTMDTTHIVFLFSNRSSAIIGSLLVQCIYLLEIDRYDRSSSFIFMNNSYSQVRAAAELDLDGHMWWPTSKKAPHHLQRFYNDVSCLSRTRQSKCIA